MLQELVIPPAILEWLGDAVLASDRTEQATRAETIKKLQARYNQIEGMSCKVGRLDLIGLRSQAKDAAVAVQTTTL